MSTRTDTAISQGGHRDGAYVPRTGSSAALNEINGDPQFEGAEISAEEFEIVREQAMSRFLRP